MQKGEGQFVEFKESFDKKIDFSNPDGLVSWLDKVEFDNRLQSGDWSQRLFSKYICDSFKINYA